MLYGIDNILQNIPHIQSRWWNILQNIAIPKEHCSGFELCYDLMMQAPWVV